MKDVEPNYLTPDMLGDCVVVATRKGETTFKIAFRSLVAASFAISKASSSSELEHNLNQLKKGKP